MQSLQSTIESILSFFLAVANSLTNNPLAMYALALLIGAMVSGIILWVVMRARCQNKCEALRAETRDNISELELQLGLKNKLLDQTQRSFEDNKHALERSELQLVQIEELTLAIENDIYRSSESTGGSEPNLSASSDGKVDSVTTDDLTHYQNTNLAEKLSSLHQHITEQAAQMSELEGELAREHDNLAHLIVDKTQKLPEIARKSFETTIVKPIYEQIDGIREKVEQLTSKARAIPHQTQQSLDRLIVRPIHEKVVKIKQKSENLSATGKAAIGAQVISPLQTGLTKINELARNLPGQAKKQLNDFFQNTVQTKIDAVNGLSRNISENTRDKLDKWIVQPVKQRFSKQDLATS